MSQHEPITHQKNRAGEHLCNVDIHFTVKDGAVTTEIYAITSTPDTGSGPQEHTGRALMTAHRCTQTLGQIDFWRSLTNLSDAFMEHALPSYWKGAIRQDAEFALNELITASENTK